MLKKLGLIALSSLLVLPAISSAEDYSFVGSFADYSPETFTTEGGVVSNFSVGDCIYSDEKCEIFISDGDFNILVQSSDCDYSENSIYCSLNGVNIPAGTYGVYVYEYSPRTSVSFSIGASSGGGSDTPENDSSLGSFSSQLSGLVGNLVSSFGGYVPAIILLMLAVCAVITFRNTVKVWSVGVFSGKSNSDLGFVHRNIIKEGLRKKSFDKYWGNEYDEFARKYHNRVSLSDSDGAYRVRRKHKYPNL